MSPVVIEIPTPPSSNGMFFNRRRKAAGASSARSPRKGRGRTQAYEAWLKEAGWEILRQKVRPVTGRVDVLISIGTSARGDIDNRTKPVQDLLVRQGIIPDDSKDYVRSVKTEWNGDVTGARITITPIT